VTKTPFALLQLAGYLAGFKGDFDFENIGDNYNTAGVPYVKMRALPAILGSLQVPIVYAIMRETGHAPTIAALSACLLAFGESRGDMFSARSHSINIVFFSIR